MTSTRYVYCEQIEQWIWDRFLPWENERIALDRLKQKYRQHQIEHPERAAFKNVSMILYHIKQARSIFQFQNQSHLWLDPLILYYGMTSLLKAVIITLDPSYPSYTRVLRHGISTRKRKKNPYHFLSDEIRVQKEGLFPHAMQLFQINIPKGSSFSPAELFSMLPELQSSYMEITGLQTLFPVTIHTMLSKPDPAGMLISVDEKILDVLHLSTNRFVDRLNRMDTLRTFFAETSISHPERIYLRWKHPEVRHVDEWANGFGHPCFYENNQGDYFLWVSNQLQYQPIPELWIYYLLAFLLSMLCRYDVPLWGEILETSKEMVLIQQLLSQVKRRFPQLILNLLEEEKLILRLR